MIARIALLAALASLFGMPGAKSAPTNKEETFDILYLSDARPVLIRLNLNSGGKPMMESWNKFADGFFTALDTDKNGTIDQKELTRLNPMLVLLTGTGLRPGTPATAIPKSMTRAELGDYLQKSGYGTLRMPPLANLQQQRSRSFRRGGIPTADELDKALLELLDANKDGKLSVSEFTAGIAILSKLDVDENELISTEELLRRQQSPFFVADFDNGMGPQPSPGVELLAINHKGADQNLARRMITRYGPKPKGPNQAGGLAPPATVDGFGPPPQPATAEPTVRRLGKKDLKMSDALFDSLDQDGDGELDMDELARFGQNAQPEVEIAIRLGMLASGVKPAQVMHAGQSPLKVYPGTRGADVVIEVPGVRLDLFAPPAVSSEAFRTAFRNRYLGRFQELDRDGNGYVDRNEAANDSVIGEHFALLDRDSDGKIFEKEINEALDEIQDLAASTLQASITIELNEMGRGLFGLIDADGDNRISIRELRAMPKLVERFDTNKDGALSTSEVPRRFEASLTPGFGSGRLLPQPVRFGGQMTLTKPQTGPVWFQKMDRNRDGDISRREFIGTDEQFRKLDTDGDGLISLQEAEAADKK